ncbi:MAG: DUF4197 domain-containing protein [Novosphingobium sp.]
MIFDQASITSRRTVLFGMAASSALAVSGCASLPAFSLTEAIRRLLTISSTNALARLMAPGGFWDNQLARLDLPAVFGNRGSVLQALLSTSAFRSRLQRELNHVAEDGARRAAPVVADAVRVVGIRNAIDLVRGGPSAATEFLRGELGGRLIEAMFPALADGLRVASDPIVGQAIAALTGVDLPGVARELSIQADNAIWGEMGREEAYIRANPESTNDPVLIGVFKAV